MADESVEFLQTPLYSESIIASSGSLAREIIREHLNAYSPMVKHIHLDFADDPSINAGADYARQTKTGYIQINKGLIHLIFDVFYRMMSHPRVLPEFGDDSVELLREPFCSEGLSSNYKDLHLSRGRSSGPLSDVAPRDPSRKAYADILAWHAITFCVLHEIAHITLGHCEFANSSGAAPLTEVNPNPLDGMTCQAIELQADWYASNGSWLRRIKSTDREKNDRRRLQRGSELKTDDQLFMFDLYFSIYVLCWMFEQKVDLDYMETSDHPPAPQRASMAIGHLINLTEDSASQQTKDQLQDARGDAGEKVVDALGRISNRAIFSYLTEYWELERKGVMLDHARRIVTRLKEIEPNLSKFTR